MRKRLNRMRQRAGEQAPLPPGVPGSETAPVEEPTEPRPPLPPKPDQGTPAPVTPTGRDTGTDPTLNAQGGEYLTTAHGARRADTDHSLKAGRRGPVLL
ncbi:catalase HPII, partial [Kocuria sp. CPCC 205292]